MNSVDEEVRYVPEASDRGILGDGMEIVEMKRVMKMIRVRGEQRRHQAA